MMDISGALIDPKYSQYFRNDGCVTCEVDKALYGLFESVKLRSKLECYGYSINR